MNLKTIGILIISVLVVILSAFAVEIFILKKDKVSIYQSSQAEVVLPPKQEVSLIAVGDISFSRGVAEISKRHNDPNYPLLKVSDYLKSADLVFGNLETAITPGREIKGGEMVFRSDPITAQLLKNAGFSILSLANNHTPNFGDKGLKDTFKYLNEAGIKYAGAGNNDIEANQPAYIEKNGIKFAFLAYNSDDVVPASYQADSGHAGTAFMNKDKMVNAVKEAKKNADIVIVSMHAGVEYTDKPNEMQINFAHLAIDSGADLVIGHHPHTIQTVEEYKGKYIFYSLGNFIFDQMWSEKTRKGLTVKMLFDKKGVLKVEYHSVMIEDYCQPNLID